MNEQIHLFSVDKRPPRNIRFKSIRIRVTLGARDFSSAVSGFCQVFIVTRPKMCRPSANTENSRRTREKPLVPRVNSGGQGLASVKFTCLISYSLHSFP